MQNKIVILGAGVSGLTVAHELSRFKKYEIHIYDKNPIIGGMARSSYKYHGNTKLPTEYCWRIYGPNYYNLREILKEIPLVNNPNKTVHDNLIDIRNYLIADEHEIMHMNNNPMTLLELRHAFKRVPFKQKWDVLCKILYCFMISTDRLNKLDHLTWNEFINPNHSLSHDMRKYIVDIMGPYLGADIRKVNVPSVVKTLESFKVFNRPISVMNHPTNEAWFDHWKRHLENQGVIFHLDTTIADINIDHNEARSITLTNGEVVLGDQFFCCLSVDSAAKIPSLNVLNLNELAKRGFQLMVGIQLYFDRKIDLPYQYTALYIPDSHWQLIIEPQGMIWDQTYDDIKGIWSIGLCDAVRQGLLVKKPFIECSHEEIKQEVWHQIMTSEFGRALSLQSINIIDYNVWNTYVLDKDAMHTNEPKFSTNKNTYFLRPDNQTTIKNLYLAAAYTKTDTDMFEMESAAESGRRAAKIIEKSVRAIPCDRPAFFAPYRLLDSLFPQLNLYKRLPFVWYCLGLPFSLVFLAGKFVRNIIKKLLKIETQ